MIQDRVYENVVTAAVHLGIALLSFVLGVLFLLGAYPSFFHATLTFALGFIFEYSIMIGNHMNGKARYCLRIRIESFVGWVSGFATIIISIIMICCTVNTATYGTLAVVSLVLSGIYVSIIGIEFLYGAADYLKPDIAIPPVTRP